MKMIKLIHTGQPFVAEHELAYQAPLVQAAHDVLHGRTGAGNDYLGWLYLPSTFDREELRRLQETAKRLSDSASLLIVIGIGGSYLGARAALQFLRHSFTEYMPATKREMQVVFAGHQMSSTYLADLMDILDQHEVAVNVISKSGTTTEPALAFRAIEAYMHKRYGATEAAKRIVATTDRERGALLTVARERGYETFVIPDDVGGRYSVLTPVGLLPLAVAGIDIDAMLAGALQAERDLAICDVEKNPAYAYAALRAILRQKGKAVEMLVSYEPGLHYFAEWWKQLFGESEGKDNKALYPSSADFSTDLHSLGQFVQEGSRVMFETVLKVAKPRRDLPIEEAPGDPDGLNYLAGKQWREVNDTALQATLLAHTAGGVPNILLEIPDMTAHTLGYLFYFFEISCAISGYMLGVNPFDQPGVEAYKTNMFALLGKPGYEAQRAALEATTLAGGR